MFTGIIESTGILREIKKTGSNLQFFIQSKLSNELKPDQSVAHDGVCLTVTENNSTGHWVTAVAETLQKTNLSDWKIGRLINLERAIKLGDRLDGHLVQGHVDGTAICTKRQEINGSHLFTFNFPETFAPLVIEKGSVCINGVSLTAFDVRATSLTVTIIPYTFSHTAFSNLAINEKVNFEFDILGKYFARSLALKSLPV